MIGENLTRIWTWPRELEDWGGFTKTLVARGLWESWAILQALEPR